jgi:hypothetical protein
VPPADMRAGRECAVIWPQGVRMAGLCQAARACACGLFAADMQPAPVLAVTRAGHLAAHMQVPQACIMHSTDSWYELIDKADTYGTR